MSPTRYSPVRHSRIGASTNLAVRLACLRRAASVRSEPGSNSPWLFSSTRRYMTSSFKFNSNFYFCLNWFFFWVYSAFTAYKLKAFNLILRFLWTCWHFSPFFPSLLCQITCFWFAPPYCLTVIKNISCYKKTVNTLFQFFFVFFQFFFIFFSLFFSSFLLLFIFAFSIRVYIFLFIPLTYSRPLNKFSYAS